MGREANCICQWADQSAPCKVMLEIDELIVRGSIRRRVPISSLTHVSVLGDQLLFRAEDGQVNLHLGSKLAQSWAKKIAAQPPDLASKLGINRESRLLLIGEFEDEELKTALAAASTTEGGDASLILAHVRTNADLSYALYCYSACLGNPPIWIIYAKGPNKPLPESEVRGALRREGFIDTKVASVSATLTALRFIKRT